MTLDNFRHALRKAAPHLRVVCNTAKEDNPWAGIEVVGKEHYDEKIDGRYVSRLPVCSVNKYGMPRDRSVLRHDGRVLVKSLRDTLLILKAKGHITDRGARKYFGMRLDKRHPPVKEAPDAKAMALSSLRYSGAHSSYVRSAGA